MLNKICLFVFVISSTFSCSQNSDKSSGYIKFESEISSDVATETFLPPHTLIVDGKGNVLEFHEKLKNSNGKYIVSDTLKIFFIETEKGRYSEYKKLDLNEKPYLTDSIENKREGASFFSKKVDFFSDVQNIKIKDTVINKIKYKFASGTKEVENSSLIYEATIAETPRNFAVQISKVLSKMTNGGFVESVRIIDKTNNRTITFKCSFESKKLPGRIDRVIQQWSKN